MKKEIKQILTLIEKVVIKEAYGESGPSMLDDVLNGLATTPIGEIDSELIIYSSEFGLDPHELEQVKRFLVNRFNQEIGQIMKTIKSTNSNKQ